VVEDVAKHQRLHEPLHLALVLVLADLGAPDALQVGLVGAEDVAADQFAEPPQLSLGAADDQPLVQVADARWAWP
jgi:hypothetical protein